MDSPFFSFQFYAEKNDKPQATLWSYKLLPASDIDNIDKIAAFFFASVTDFYDLYIADINVEKCLAFIEVIKSNGFTMFINCVVRSESNLKGIHCLIACKETDEEKLSNYFNQIMVRERVNVTEYRECKMLINYSVIVQTNLYNLFHNIRTTTCKLRWAKCYPRLKLGIELSDATKKRNLSIIRLAKRLTFCLSSRLFSSREALDNFYIAPAETSVRETTDVLNTWLTKLANEVPPMLVKKACETIFTQLSIFNHGFRDFLRCTNTDLPDLIDALISVSNAFDRLNDCENNWSILKRIRCNRNGIIANLVTYNSTHTIDLAFGDLHNKLADGSKKEAADVLKRDLDEQVEALAAKRQQIQNTAFASLPAKGKKEPVQVHGDNCNEQLINLEMAFGNLSVNVLSKLYEVVDKAFEAAVHVTNLDSEKAEAIKLADILLDEIAKKEDEVAKKKAAAEASVESIVDLNKILAAALEKIEAEPEEVLAALTNKQRAARDKACVDAADLLKKLLDCLTGPQKQSDKIATIAAEHRHVDAKHQAKTEPAKGMENSNNSVECVKNTVVIMGRSETAISTLLKTICHVLQCGTFETAISADPQTDTLLTYSEMRKEHVVQYGTDSIRFVNMTLNAEDYKNADNVVSRLSEYPEILGIITVIDNNEPKLPDAQYNELCFMYKLVLRKAFKNCCIVNVFNATATFDLNRASTQLTEFLQGFCERHRLTDVPMNSFCIDGDAMQSICQFRSNDNAQHDLLRNAWLSISNGFQKFMETVRADSPIVSRDLMLASKLRCLEDWLTQRRKTITTPPSVEMRFLMEIASESLLTGMAIFHRKKIDGALPLTEVQIVNSWEHWQNTVPEVAALLADIKQL